MTLELKKLLPKNYSRCGSKKNAYEYEENGVVREIRLEKSDFLTGEDQWILVFSVSAFDSFSVYDEIESSLIIGEFSVVDGAVDILERWDQVTHWDLDDQDGVEETLNKIVLPWLSWFAQPLVLIDYLMCLEKLETVSSKAAKKFGSVLTSNTNRPPRTRKYYNGVIATLYEFLGDSGSAVQHLRKHKKFLTLDHTPCEDKQINDAFSDAIKLVDEGIKRLSSE